MSLRSCCYLLIKPSPSPSQVWKRRFILSSSPVLEVSLLLLPVLLTLTSTTTAGAAAAAIMRSLHSRREEEAAATPAAAAESSGARGPTQSLPGPAASQARRERLHNANKGVEKQALRLLSRTNSARAASLANQRHPGDGARLGSSSRAQARSWGEGRGRALLGKHRKE